MKGMMRNRRLSRALADSAVGELLQQLAYKAQWYGRDLVEADPWYPSTKTCSKCQCVASSITLSVRAWQCPVCKTEHDRDLNAAANLRNKALECLSLAAA